MRNVSTFLDNTRWVAALLVASSHLRNDLMVDWPQVAHHGFAIAAFYWLTGFGRTAVIVFFVLSGYLVGGRCFVSIRERTFDGSDYVINRLSRLYPPLLAAVFVTIVFDGAGLHFGNAGGFYDYPNHFHIAGETHPVADTLNVTTALLNLAFLQTLVAPTLGSNGPLWSLANEFWYYVLAPIVGLLLFGASRKRPALTVALAGALLLISLLNRSVVLLFSTWLVGAFAYRYAAPQRSIVARCLLGVFLAVAVAVRTIHWFPEHQFVADLTVAAAFGALVWSLGRPGRTASPNAALASRLAGFSYSLYLVHAPLVFLFAALVLEHSSVTVRLQPGFTSMFAFATGLAVAIGFAYSVSLATEARTGEVRAWLGRRVKALPLGPGNAA